MAFGMTSGGGFGGFGTGVGGGFGAAAKPATTSGFGTSGTGGGLLGTSAPGAGFGVPSTGFSAAKPATAATLTAGFGVPSVGASPAKKSPYLDFGPSSGIWTLSSAGPANAACIISNTDVTPEEIRVQILMAPSEQRAQICSHYLDSYKNAHQNFHKVLQTSEPVAAGAPIAFASGVTNSATTGFAAPAAGGFGTSPVKPFGTVGGGFGPNSGGFGAPKTAGGGFGNLGGGFGKAQSAAPPPGTTVVAENVAVAVVAEKGAWGSKVSKAADPAPAAAAANPALGGGAVPVVVEDPHIEAWRAANFTVGKVPECAPPPSVL